MPFTPAHAAIVLPFLKWRRLSATALIIGSVVPDFEYFLRMSTHGKFSHTLGGLFYFDIPMVFVLSFLFHHVAKKNLLENLPGFFQRRFYDTLEFNFKNYLKTHFLIFLLSAFVGSLSHLLWDSFTHRGGFFAQLLGYHKGVYYEFDGVDYPLYYSLQHVSTVIGLLIVGIYILVKKSMDINKISKPNLLYWIALTAIALFFYWLRYYLQSYDFNFGNKVVTCISASLISLLICGLIPFRKRYHDNHNTEHS